MIEKLEYLLALAQERHFGRAAIACGIPQPTFSAGIKQLEESFGMQLVERGSRFRGFTEAGERVLEWSRRIVGDARAMRQDVASLRHALSGRLRIAAIPTSMPLLTRLTVPFAARHPDVAISIVSRTSDEILTLLENLEVDAGITYLDHDKLRRVTAVPLFRERFRLVCAASDPLAGRASVAWTDLVGVRLCLLTPDMQNRRIIDEALAAAGVEARVALASDSMLTLLAHLRTGQWASILPDQWLEIIGLGSGLRAIPRVSPELVNTVGLVVPNREPMGALAAALIAQAELLDRES